MKNFYNENTVDDKTRIEKHIYIKLMFLSCLLVFIFTSYIFAQTAATVTVNSTSGPTIPNDFIGISFGPSSAFPNNLMDSTNTSLLTLFKTLGIKFLRMGGTSIDSSASNPGYHPTHNDIDSMFAVVKAAGLKAIYSLRLENGDSLREASTAKYVWDNYNQYLICYAIGNEPNIYGSGDPEIKNYSTYIAKWQRYAATIIDSVPNAKFGGPDNTTGGTTWAKNFTNDEAGSGYVTQQLIHEYVGGSSSGKTAQQLIDAMLSESWLTTNYQNCYNNTLAIALSDGASFYITEGNSSLRPEVTGGNDGYATALWLVDYMHWWAEKGAAGISVHTGFENYNGEIHRDTIDNWHWYVYPKAYGIKAFDAGGHGTVKIVSISNPNNLNLTSYAVSNSDSLYVTVINKEHDSGARDAAVTITSTSLPQSAAVMYLSQKNKDTHALGDIKFGAATINDSGSFQGRWTILNTNLSGSITVNVPYSSAAVVWFTNQLPSSPPPAPTLALPNNDSTVWGHPTLSWNSVTGSTEYRVQIASDSSFSNIVSDTVVEGTSVVIIDTLPVNTKYYWHVASANSTFFSSFSSAKNFYYVPLASLDYEGPIQINEQGTLELFGTGTNNNGNVWHIWQLADSLPNSGSGSWHSWVDMQGGVQAVSGEVAVTRNLDGTLQIFIEGGTGTNGDVFYKRQTAPNSGWGSWTDIGGAGISDLHVTNNPDGSLDLFGRDSNGNIYHTSQTTPAGTTWTSWSQITGKALGEGFAVAQNHDGRIVLAGVDTASTHHVFLKWQQMPGEGWGGSWQDLGNINGKGTYTELRIARLVDNRLFIFGRGNNDDIWRCWQVAGSADTVWSNFSDLGKNLRPGFIVTRFSDGRLIVIGMGGVSPNHVFYISMNSPSGGWGSWTDLSLPSGVKFNEHFVGAVTNDDRPQFFCQGSDGNIWSSWWENSSNQWRSWSGNGPNFDGSNITWLFKIAHGNDSVKTKEVETPFQYKLYENYPNPFNPSTTIRFEIPENTFVNISIFNMLGEKVATLVNGNMGKGVHEINFDASKLASGVYMYRLKSKGFTQTKKMMILK